jgi:UDP-N-acetylmuramate dehydrogenase
MTFSDKLIHIVRQKESLAPFTWLRLGGEAKFFAEPGSLDEMASLIKEAAASGLATRLLGSGSNLLVREEGVDGLVIHLATAELCSISTADERLTARAGAKLNHVISAAVAAGLGGLEHLAGIPGTVGAALASNAGITNDDIGSRVSSVTTINRLGKLEKLSSSQLQFGFRRSNLQDSFIAEVEFKLRSGNSAELTRRMQSNWIIRRAAQPTTGSRTVQAFIEPDGTRLADVLEAAGVRDAREGDFAMDWAHPGFVIATGQPKSKDLLALLARVSRSVEVKSGIQLQSQLKIW